jgi:hypothetical protein
MKKSNLILVAASILMSMVSVASRAQTAMNGSKASFAYEAGLFSKPKTATSAAVNLKAERNFKKDYQQASGAEWSILGDHSLMCRFSMSNNRYRAFYTAHGQWISTVSSYDASKLNKGVYDKIKSVYYNSRIVFADQIDRVNGNTIYVVEIQDENSIKKLRVDGDEMEIVQEFDKH